MAYYESVADLIRDALWRAGEPTDGSSDYQGRVLDYFNRVQLGLLLGGPFGTADQQLASLPLLDWWWARSVALLTTLPAVTAGTVSLASGSTAVTFSVAPAVSLQDRWLRVGERPLVPRIVSHSAGATTATLDTPWPDTTVTGEPFVAAALTLPLPDDWLRAAGPGTVVSLDPPAVGELAIVDWSTLEATAPRASLAEGLPTLAALVGPRTLELRRWTRTAARIELPYVRLAPTLTPDGTPLLPPHHRPLLAIGAAALVLLDKADDKVTSVVSEFRAAFSAMAQEHWGTLRRMGPQFGQIRPRLTGERRPRPVTAGGLEL